MSTTASSQVNGPAIGLIITGALGGLMAVLGLVSGLTGMGGFDPSQLEGIEGISPEQLELIARITGGGGMALNVVGLALAAFIIFGALKMQKLEGWGLAMGASVLAAIPCLSPCCCIGLPIGIWAAVVLSKDEVKSAFR